MAGPGVAGQGFLQNKEPKMKKLLLDVFVMMDALAVFVVTIWWCLR